MTSSADNNYYSSLLERVDTAINITTANQQRTTNSGTSSSSYEQPSQIQICGERVMQVTVVVGNSVYVTAQAFIEWMKMQYYGTVNVKRYRRGMMSGASTTPFSSEQQQQRQEDSIEL
jgi:hypothetical protein